jgi:hypothetical protein
MTRRYSFIPSKTITTLTMMPFRNDSGRNSARHGLRPQRSWRRNSVLLSSLKRWRKPGGSRCAEWVGFRRGKLIAGCYGSRTRMKTASARFFFWSASFHEEGGLVGWPRLLILLGSANAACAPSFAFLAKGRYHESLRAGGARNGRALCRYHRARTISAMSGLSRDPKTLRQPFLLKTCAWTARFFCQGSPASLR